VTEDSLALLVGRARRGDSAASEALVRRFLRPAYAVALAIVGRTHEAEDIAQDALATAFEQLDTCRDPERFGAWLMQIVRNRARNALSQRNVRERDVIEPESTVLNPRPEATGLRERLVAALAELHPIEREVVLLYDLEGWSHTEIAAALELSEVNSRQRLFQARQKLRARLEADKPDGGV